MSLLLLALSTLALAATAPTEPPVPGCQNLEARAVKPIPLRGKIYANFLADGRTYSYTRPPAAPDPLELGVLDLGHPGTSLQRFTSDDRADAEVAVSPDHKQITWAKRPLVRDFDHDNEIRVANADFTNERVVYRGDRYLGIPTFTRDGREVAFSSQGPNDKFTKLAFVNLATGAYRELKTDFPGSISDPMLSPDGKWLAFKSFEQKDTTEAQLYLMRADGTGVRRLTRNDYKDEDPAFSPDGRYLAFERMYGDVDHAGQAANDRYFQEGIVVIDLKTGKETALTQPDPCGKNELWLPTWSRDGELIMLTRGWHLESGEFTHDLWVMRKDGSDLQRVPGSEGIMFFDWAE